MSFSFMVLFWNLLWHQLMVTTWCAVVTWQSCGFGMREIELHGLLMVRRLTKMVEWQG